MNKIIENIWARNLIKSDIQSFTAIFKKYYNELCRFSYVILQCKDTAEEIVQLTFVSIWENHKTLKIHTNLKAFLYTTVKNNSLNHIKANDIRETHENEYINKASETDRVFTDNDVFKKKLQENLEKLPRQCRIVFCMKYMEGLTYKEISTYLEISVNTVENHVRNALSKLRELLFDYRNNFHE